MSQVQMQTGHPEVPSLTHILTSSKRSTLLGFKIFSYLGCMGLSTLEKKITSNLMNVFNSMMSYHKENNER